ncbi:SMC family ATPase, partial [Candidatus Woesearchaeota archaeon]|nr:SMC family ATPase [Candidatus Woesearchaeota archaeon]
MILKSLKIEDVKCFEDAEIEFVRGKNVIVGQNGAGKSTLLQSIYYSLFGSYPRGSNSDLIRTGENSSRFSLEIDHYGRDLLVERKLRESGTEAVLLERPNDIELAIKQSVVTEEIEDILDVKKEVFADVILVQQGEIAQIIGMKKSDRKNLFNKLLGIHDYEQAWEKCRRITSTLKSLKEQSLSLIEGQREIASKLPKRKKDLEEMRTYLKSYKAELMKLKAQYTEVHTQWKEQESLERRIGELEASIEGQEDSLEIHQDALNDHQDNITYSCTTLDYTIPSSFTRAKMSILSKTVNRDLTKTKEELTTKRGQHEDYVREGTRLANLYDKVEG